MVSGNIKHFDDWFVCLVARKRLVHHHIATVHLCLVIVADVMLDVLFHRPNVCSIIHVLEAHDYHTLYIT
jgi:hypothetical protein